MSFEGFLGKDTALVGRGPKGKPASTQLTSRAVADKVCKAQCERSCSLSKRVPCQACLVRMLAPAAVPLASQQGLAGEALLAALPRGDGARESTWVRSPFLLRKGHPFHSSEGKHDFYDIHVKVSFIVISLLEKPVSSRRPFGPVTVGT